MSNAYGPDLNCWSAFPPGIVKSFYPLEAMTKFHANNHLDGVTGRWMDTGLLKSGGHVNGSWHRMTHGHSFFDDGFKVLVSDRLSYGDFLHHLGMDIFTKQGIPIVPACVYKSLIAAGMPERIAGELLSLNMPKILSGSLGLLCSGPNAYLAFSNALPHTFGSAFSHLAIGSLEIAFGCYPPNILLLSAGGLEIFAGSATLARAIIDPVVPALGVPYSVFLPALAQSVLFGSIIGGGVRFMLEGSVESLAKGVVAGGSAGAASLTASYVFSGAGIIAPFLIPIVGIASYLIANKTLDYFLGSGNKEFITNSLTVEDPFSQNSNSLIPLTAFSEEPMGKIVDSKLVFNEVFIRKNADRICRMPV
jgi:hypothetical protein